MVSGKFSIKSIMSKRTDKQQQRVALLGAPLGFGASKPGSELGVEAICLSKIRGQYLIDHIRNLGYAVSEMRLAQITQPAERDRSSENPRYLAEMAESNRNIASIVKEELDSGALPIIIGGDHSIAIGSFSGISSHFHKRGEQVGLIWFDAHADINTPETTPTGNIHGMPVAVLLGHGSKELVEIEGFSPKLNPKYFAHIGARDLDEGERQAVYKYGLRDNFFTMSDIDKRGMQACVEDALKIVSAASGGFAVTFDVDIIDPRFAPGSGTLVRGGATYREAHLALESIAEHGGLRAFEIVEVNPLLDEHNITVELAGELILSALGKTIL